MLHPARLRWLTIQTRGLTERGSSRHSSARIGLDKTAKEPPSVPSRRWVEHEGWATLQS